MYYHRNLRWEHYIIRHGTDFDLFWEQHLRKKERNLLYILGLGFDPRMCTGIKAILNAKSDCITECSLIVYDEGQDSPSKKYTKLIDHNHQNLKEMLTGKCVIKSSEIQMWSDDGRRIGPRRASELLEDTDLIEFTDIIVDISALPRSIYFPIIAKLLFVLDKRDKEKPVTNLHIVTAEDVHLDMEIQEEGIDENASYLPGFSSDLEREAIARIPVVWIPVLGKGKEAQLTRMYDQIKPDEICPVFPSPSTNPRRSDDLILEYRELLFDRLRVEPQNIIYSCEKNPFETYRQLFYALCQYNKALEALGGAKVVISAVSSKLLSIGALLAAYEAKRAKYMIGISHIESHGYKLNNDNVEKNQSELYSMWLSGECYEG